MSRAADFVQELYKTHNSYPALRYFHFRRSSYSLPRIPLVAFDAVALLDTAVAPPRPGPVSRPPSAALSAAAHELLNELMPRRRCDSAEASSAEQKVWRQRHRRAVATLAADGLSKTSRAAGEQYIATRSGWNPQLKRLADSMLYQCDEIESESA